MDVRQRNFLDGVMIEIAKYKRGEIFSLVKDIRFSNEEDNDLSIDVVVDLCTQDDKREFGEFLSNLSKDYKKQEINVSFHQYSSTSYASRKR